MRLAVLDDYQGVSQSLADWSGVANEVEITVFSDTLSDADALAARLAPFEILCVMRERTPLPESLIAGLPRLQLIVTTGMRNDAIDVSAAAARGIVVCGTDSPGHATAELTMGLIVALARRIIFENRGVREGAWQLGLGRDLRGATLGVIGLGRLGGQVATYAQAFGMRIVAWSENLTEQRCVELGVARSPSLEALLVESDFVTIHQRLSTRTRGLIGAEQLALMKPDAALINTSRGPIVHWRALLSALENGRPGAAALDVYDSEPLAADHPLRAAEKLLLTPHIGYVTRETYEVFFGQTVEAVAAWLRGAPIRVIEPSTPSR